MRIDIQAELTPEILAEAGVEYSTKDKVFGAKYRKIQRNQIIRGAGFAAVGLGFLVAFVVSRRSEMLVIALLGFMLGGTGLYTALVLNKKKAIEALKRAGGETRHRRYLITDKKIESTNPDTGKTTLLRWDDFDRMLTTDNTIILLGKKVLVLPKAALDEEQTTLLSSFLAERYHKL